MNAKTVNDQCGMSRCDDSSEACLEYRGDNTDDQKDRTDLNDKGSINEKHNKVGIDDSSNKWYDSNGFDKYGYNQNGFNKDNEKIGPVMAALRACALYLDYTTLNIFLKDDSQVYFNDIYMKYVR